jgi:preprotein translocase subunit YajC
MSTPTTSPSQGIASMLPMLLAFGVIFYFMLIRPQNKRAKEQQALINNLQKDDEIITSGGILGKIVKITEQFIVIAIAENTNITVQKQMISSCLPKGTLKTI